MSFFEYIQTNWREVFDASVTHIEISLISAIVSVLIAVPAGIVLTRHKKTAKAVLAVSGVIQTIPGLVMLGIGLMLFGLGNRPSIIVLVAYAVLPIMQNTYTGISEIERLYIEAAKGIGMSDLQVLAKVEIPLAAAPILSGIRLSVVYIISWATLAALIGAGGLGDLIWTGLSSYDTNLILAGAIPASLLAILAGLLIDMVQKAFTPRGMRMKGDSVQ